MVIVSVAKQIYFQSSPILEAVHQHKSPTASGDLRCHKAPKMGEALYNKYFQVYWFKFHKLRMKYQIFNRSNIVTTQPNIQHSNLFQTPTTHPTGAFLSNFHSTYSNN